MGHVRYRKVPPMIVPIRLRVDVTRPRDPWDPEAVDVVERYTRHVLAAAALHLEDRLALEHGLEVDVTIVAEGPAGDVVVRPAPPLAV